MNPAAMMMNGGGGGGGMGNMGMGGGMGSMGGMGGMSNMNMGGMGINPAALMGGKFLASLYTSVIDALQGHHLPRIPQL